MNDEMKTDIERLLAEGERLAAEQGRPTIKTKLCWGVDASSWMAWIGDDPDFICVERTEAEAIGTLIMKQSDRLGILLKRGINE